MNFRGRQTFLPTKVRREKGQALVFGIFVVFASLLVLFYLFNAGQLTGEKTKLVNTADAVAYSAGLLEARALNFDAYGNRALIANEVAIAQMVSLSSWAQYAGQVGQNLPLQLASPRCFEPMVKGMVLTYGLCLLLGPTGWAYTQAADPITIATQAAAAASEVLKTVIRSSQSVLHGGALAAARQSLMNRVAEANYSNDGAVQVDLVPLEDNFNSLASQYRRNGRSGDERARLGELVKTAAYRDDFVRSRSWTESSLLPTCVGLNGIFFDTLKRRGGTELLGYDEWKAMDTMSIHRAYMDKWGRCQVSEGAMGGGEQSATRESQPDGSYGGARRENPAASGMASSSDWSFYTGVPDFYDLSEASLSKLNPNVRLAIRLTREKAQTRTTETSSQIKVSGNLAVYQANEASNVIAAASSAEVFFERTEPRQDRKKELASLFNPFWHVHLIPNSSSVKSSAASLQGATPISE